MSTIHCRIVPADPAEHLFEVVLDVEHPDPTGQRFALPVWIRGSYLLRELAKHVVWVQATAQGRAVAIRRLDKHRFVTAAVVAPLRLTYAVYAYDASVRKAYLDPERAFFNFSSLCYRVEGVDGDGYEIELARPPAGQGNGWRVATTLPPLHTDADGFGRFRADDYEILIDHPVTMGRFRRVEFHAGDIPHALVLSGRCEPDADRLAHDLKRLCETQRAFFGNEPGMTQYLFLCHVGGNGYGGLEHRNCSALVAARDSIPRPGHSALRRGYRSFLGLASHEYFHLWNVKRLTSEQLQRSDLGSEAYTQDLWAFEGITSYYDDLMLLRAGLIDVPQYLDLLAETATRLQRSPARQVQTLADASFEAWIKYYQPDEDAPNAALSYYVKGALVALCLDLTLRLRGSSLDEVMREAWVRHGRSGAPLPEGGLEQLAIEIGGADLVAFFERTLRSTEELGLAEVLEPFGIEARLRTASGPGDEGGRSEARGNSAVDLGLRLRAGETTVAHVLRNGPAASAGVSGGDVILALDGLRVTAANWSTRLETLAAGRRYPLHLFRGDELLDVMIEPRAAPVDTWGFALASASDAVVARRTAWLGS